MWTHVKTPRSRRY